MSETILTLANGIGVDLLAPRAADVDFEAIAEHLAKEKRYNGATPGVEYSVAQHSVIGARAILASDLSWLAGAQPVEAAAYFLLHDGHEAVLKDDTTPKKRALAKIAEQHFGVLAGQIMAAFNLLTDRHDAAIHQAAGLSWPAPARVLAVVKAFDLVMFVTEWRDLMQGVPHPNWQPYAGIAPLRDPIIPLPWRFAKDEWLDLAAQLLPACKGRRFSPSVPSGARPPDPTKTHSTNAGAPL